jgi:hypothetical protein
MNNPPVLLDYRAVARQIIALSDVRKKTQFAKHSLLQAKDSSQEDSRYYAITALVATSIEPRRAGAVTKRLLPALDAYQNEKLADLSPEEGELQRTEFVERFLKFEYGVRSDDAAINGQR